MTLPFQLKWVSNMIQIKFIEKVNQRPQQRAYTHTQKRSYDEVHQSKAEHKLNIGWSNCDLFWIIHGMVCHIILSAGTSAAHKPASQPTIYEYNTINATNSVCSDISLPVSLSLYLTVCVYLLISYLIHFMWCDEIRDAIQCSAMGWHACAYLPAFMIVCCLQCLCNKTQSERYMLD